MQRVLLLNSAARTATRSMKWCNAYRNDTAGDAAGIDGCIISKLDEATHLGFGARRGDPPPPARVLRAPPASACREHLELAQADALVERAFLDPAPGARCSPMPMRRAVRPAPPSRHRPARVGADDALRSLTDSANAVGVCVEELNGAQYGFDVARSLWQQRGAGAPALRQMAQAIRN